MAGTAAPLDPALTQAELEDDLRQILSPLAQWLAGGSVVAPRAWSVTHVKRWLEELKLTWYSCGPTTHRAILAQLTPSFAGRAHSLRFVRSGGSRLPQLLRDEIARALRVPVLDVYGLTETGALTSTDLEQRTPHGSVGRSMGVELAILGEAGKLLEADQEGEIAVRGASVTPGYCDDAEANAAAFHAGWFRTGDLGHFDRQRSLFLTGRLKEMINRGGQKIVPDEIDAVLARHPAVFEEAAFGVMSEAVKDWRSSGEMLKRSAIMRV